MKFRYLLFIVFIMVLSAGCYDEDKIVPTEGSERMYSLPQGDHDYDEDIVEWFEKYGFYTLYDYNLDDLYWENTGWSEKLEPNLGGRLLAKQGDPEYVGKMLKLFKELFLDYYPEEWLRECMPLKVFLCSGLWDVDWKEGGSLEFGDSTRLWVYNGYDHIAINGASQEIDTIGESMKTKFMKDINMSFMARLINAKKMVAPNDFLRRSSYIYKTYSNNKWFPAVNDFSNYPWGFGPNSLFKDGYLNIQTVKEGMSKEQCQLNDFYYYVVMVMSYSLAELEQENAYWNQSYNGTNVDLRGVLYEKRGFTKVREKYDALVKYIEEDLGVNLDRIRFPERFETEEEENNN
ncbi:MULTISPECIES: hypothetical protein [Butyricimonas]|uniref:hypothetical protein n=1 Tax=Butyricimonas TaxID=574697 RepID=UPI001D07C293|nr:MULTISPECIES: hypothetical protein [Butyricimonas]MCB6974740.1 hypothetical protein [Butyricimonas synergistica]MCG4521482.1 hypothetical protein [Butyricimonas sp. DFI.6.44]